MFFVTYSLDTRPSRTCSRLNRSWRPPGARAMVAGDTHAPGVRERVWEQAWCSEWSASRRCRREGLLRLHRAQGPWNEKL